MKESDRTIFLMSHNIYSDSGYEVSENKSLYVESWWYGIQNVHRYLIERYIGYSNKVIYQTTFMDFTEKYKNRSELFDSFDEAMEWCINHWVENRSG